VNAPSAEELAARARDGNRSSFDELVVRYRPRLVAFLARRLADASEAEDVAQETFLRAYDRIAQYDPSRPFGTWLFAIVRNVVIDVSRARAVRPPLAAGVTTDDLGALDDEVEQILTAWQVEEALRMLSTEHQRALLEVHYKGRPYDEVARELGVPVGTVKSRVYYALKAMRLALDELGWSDDV